MFVVHYIWLLLHLYSLHLYVTMPFSVLLKTGTIFSFHHKTVQIIVMTMFWKYHGFEFNLVKTCYKHQRIFRDTTKKPLIIIIIIMQSYIVFIFVFESVVTTYNVFIIIIIINMKEIYNWRNSLSLWINMPFLFV